MEFGAIAVGVVIGAAIAGAGLWRAGRARRCREGDRIRAAADTAWMRAAYGDGPPGGGRDGSE